MASRIVQVGFHISDGINYIACGLSLIMAITMPFAIGIFNGFEGAVYGPASRLVIFFVCLCFAFLSFVVTRHNIIAVAVLTAMYLLAAVSAKSVLWAALLYVSLTGGPYVLAFIESNLAKNT